MSTTRHIHLNFAPMTLDDVEIVGELEQVCFPSPWSATTYRQELCHNRLSFYWVIRPQAGELERGLSSIFAYGGYWLMGDEAHVVTIATHPNWRRRGLGEWLLLEMVAAARTKGAHMATLEVRVSNHAAQSLYKKLGFEEVGRRKQYYRDNGEDALLLTLFHLDIGAVWRPLAQQLAALRTLAARFEVTAPVLH